jgi:hypothetical protein
MPTAFNGVSRFTAKSQIVTGALVTMTSDFNVGSTPTAVEFDAEQYDYGGWHSIASNKSRLTVPTTGVTRVYVSAGVALNGVTVTETVRIVLKKNGASVIGGFNIVQVVDTTTPAHSMISAVLDVVAGDYFEMFVSVDSTANVESDTTWFAIQSISTVTA